MPAERVQQPGGVAAEAAQQCFTWCPLDRELANSAEVTAISIEILQIEDLGFAVEGALVPLGAAVEAARHLLLERHLAVPQGQEQVVDTLFGRKQRRERREGDTRAQVHQYRVHRFCSELFGEFFTDQDVADRLTLAEPQRLQGSGPVRPPRQLQVGEGLEQLLRTHAVHALDGLVDRIVLGYRLLGRAAHHGALGIQRPFGVADPERAAVHLELPLTAASRGMQGQLHLARTLLGQNDRLVEEHVFRMRRGADRGQCHRGVRRTGDDDGAVDDVIGQPRLRLDGQPAGVDRVAGREFLGAAQDSGADGTVDRDRRGLGPEAAVLERIGGQFHLAVRLSVERSEIRPVATDVGRGQRVSDLAPVADSLAQRDDGPRRGQVLRPDLHRSAGQYRLRTDLHQHRATQGRHRAHALGELHRLARMPPPVLRIERSLSREHRTGAVAHQRQRRRSELHLRSERFELVEHGIEQFRMERVAGLQPRAADAVVLESGDDLLEILARARKHGVGAVVRADRHPRELARDLLDVFGVGEHRHHPPARGQAAEQPAAVSDQPRTVFEAEHSGNTRRRVLTDAVPQHHVGLDAPRLPEPRQAHLDGEERRLRKRGVPQPRCGLTVCREHDLEQRMRQDVVDRVRAALHGIGENRFGVEQFACHPRVLAALPGEQPGRRRVVDVLAAEHAGARAVLGQIGKAHACVGDRIHDQRGAMLEVRTARACGQAYVGEVGVRVGVQPRRVALRQRHQGLRRPRGQRQHVRTGLLGRALRRRLR